MSTCSSSVEGPNGKIFLEIALRSVPTSTLRSRGPDQTAKTSHAALTGTPCGILIRPWESVRRVPQANWFQLIGTIGRFANRDRLSLSISWFSSALLWSCILFRERSALDVLE